MDPDQTAPIGAVCTGSTLFASLLSSTVILGNYLQQTTSADNFSRRHFQMHFFLSALRVNCLHACFFCHLHYFFQNIPSGITLEYQTFWIKIRPDVLLGLIWVQTVCRDHQQTTKLNPSRQRVNIDQLMRFWYTGNQYNMFIGINDPYTTHL